MTRFEVFKQFVLRLMSDGNNAQELSSYSFVISVVGFHALVIYHEHIGQYTTLTEYASAWAIVAGGHGAAYLLRK